MSDLFTRNIQNIRKIEDQALKTNDVNDLLEDVAGNHYIRRRKDYHSLTDNVKTIITNQGDLSTSVDEDNKVTLPNYVYNINYHSKALAKTDKGLVTLPDFPLTVNGVKPDQDGNVTIATGGGSIGIASSYIDVGLATWTVVLNKGVDLDNSSINVEQRFGSLITVDKETIPDSYGLYIDVNKNQDYTKIEFSLSDSYDKLFGQYVMTIQIDNYELVAISTVNPVFNSPEIADYILGVYPNDDLKMSLHFAGAGLMKFIGDNRITVEANGQSQIPASETDTFIELAGLSTGANSLVIKVGGVVVWGTSFFNA